MRRLKRVLVLTVLTGALGLAAATGAGWKWSVPKGQSLPVRHPHPIPQANGWTWD
jgi:hypothetical protein